MNIEMEYFDEVAELYDELYQNEEEKEFYLDLAQKEEEPVLEIGCGTGRIYLELLSEGIEVYGIDFSERMLDVLEGKARKRGLKSHVRKADMADFEPKRKYGLVIIPARTFPHNLTLKSQKRTLQNIKRSLRANGKLALNFPTSNFEYIRDIDGKPDKQTFFKDNEEYVLTRIMWIEDEINQIIKAKETVEVDGEVILEESFRFALISKNHFELLLETTGWSDWEVYGDFNYEPLESSEQEMIWIAAK